MTPVILESPYGGPDRDRNIAYARACMLDALHRNEAPFASHLLYTQVLEDNDPESRRMGMGAGFAWIPKAHYCVVYVDHGISPGMEQGITLARAFKLSIYYRRLSDD